jgi:hypothetical protein
VAPEIVVSFDEHPHDLDAIAEHDQSLNSARQQPLKAMLQEDFPFSGRAGDLIVIGQIQAQQGVRLDRTMRAESAPLDEMIQHSGRLSW